MEPGLVESSTRADTHGHDHEFIEVVMIDGHGLGWLDVEGGP